MNERSDLLARGQRTRIRRSGQPVRMCLAQAQLLREQGRLLDLDGQQYTLVADELRPVRIVIGPRDPD